MSSVKYTAVKPPTSAEMSAQVLEPSETEAGGIAGISEILQEGTILPGTTTSASSLPRVSCASFYHDTKSRTAEIEKSISNWEIERSTSLPVNLRFRPGGLSAKVKKCLFDMSNGVNNVRKGMEQFEEPNASQKEWAQGTGEMLTRGKLQLLMQDLSQVAQTLKTESENLNEADQNSSLAIISQVEDLSESNEQALRSVIDERPGERHATVIIPSS